MFGLRLGLAVHGEQQSKHIVRILVVALWTDNGDGIHQKDTDKRHDSEMARGEIVSIDLHLQTKSFLV